MAGVFIDIPGVGNVEAKNAATEATLREILKAMQGVQKNTGGKGGSGGAGSGGGGGGGGDAGPAGAAGGLGLLGKAAGAAGLAAKGLGMAAGVAVGVLGKMTGGVVKVSGAAVGLSEAAIGAAEGLSRLDGSASGVAAIFGNIPLFGKAFSAVAGAADDVVKSYNSVSQSGASFGGSIANFSKSASEAGMSMAEFGALIKSNGQGMLGFGATTEDGAANFARVAKQVRTTGSDLYALGFSTQEINSGLANYGALMRQQGLQGKKSNDELAKGAKSYLKEMDQLAKITGEERSAKEAQAKQLAADAQFQASMSGMNEEVRASFRNTVLGLPGPLQNFTKDMLANGVATTEENQKLMAMMPQSAAMMQKLNAKMQRGEQVTMEERNALNNLMKQEGGKNLQNIKQAGAASSELAGVVGGLAATQQINTDGVKEATEAQKKAQANTDKFNEKMAGFQQRIAEVSNTFKGLLATSGILDVMMQAFDFLSKVAMQYLVPAFNIITSVVMKVANGISLLLAPVIDYLSEKFGASGLGGTVEFIDGLMNTVFESVGGAVRMAILVFDGLYDGVMSLLEPFKGLMSAVFGTGEGVGSFGDILIDVGAFVGDALRLLGTVIGGVVTFLTPAIKAVVDVFKFLWNTVSTVIDFFSNLGNHLADFGDGISGIIDKILFMLPNKLGGISKEEKERRDAQRQMSKDERDAARAAREASKTKTAEQHKTELKEDKKAFAEKKVTSEKLTAVAKKEAEVKEAAVKANEKLMDFNAGPEELLKAFSGKEGGKVELGIKKGEAVKEKSAADKEFAEAKTTAEKKAALAKVEAAEKKIENLEKAIASPKNINANSSKQGEATKKELEAKGEEKTAADKKTQQEAEAKKAAEEKAKESEGKKEAPAQESAESLLAQLNSNMAQLVRINQEQKDIGERQLSVQRSLTGDLFASV
jgi:hypothetical protein